MRFDRWRTGAIALSLLSSTLKGLPAEADSLALAGGYAEQTDVVNLSWMWDAAAPLQEFGETKLTAHLEANAMWLHGTRSNIGGYKNLTGIGLTPIARVEWSSANYAPFMELGIGATFLSHTKLQNDQQFGTSFQFDELIGAGMRFGAAQAYELGLRLEHMSNANIKQPNDGLTFGEIRVAYRY